MPIKGLTDRDEVRFPRIGFLRKGGPKRERQKQNGDKYEIMGLDLDHFRFDSDDDDATDTFQLAYGDEPKQVNVFLPWPEVDQNFQAWKEAYTSGALQHRCDGETCVLWLDAKTQTYSTEPKPCPGGCKEIGYLSVIIPELKRLAFVTVLTHSKHDIMELQANLEAYRAMTGQLRGVPFVLRRVEREVSTPDEKSGKRVRRKKWLMHIETAPRWTKIMLTGAEYSAIPAHVRAALPAPIEAQYVIEGFATDQRIAEIDAMPDAERREMLQTNITRMRGPDWEDFKGFGDEPLPPKQQPADTRNITVERPASVQDTANDAAFEQLPSASQERNGGNGKAAASTEALPFKDQGTAVKWACEFTPYYRKDGRADPAHAVGSIKKLCADLGCNDRDLQCWGSAWVEYVNRKHAELEAV